MKTQELAGQSLEKMMEFALMNALDEEALVLAKQYVTDHQQEIKEMAGRLFKDALKAADDLVLSVHLAKLE